MSRLNHISNESWQKREGIHIKKIPWALKSILLSNQWIGKTDANRKIPVDICGKQNHCELASRSQSCRCSLGDHRNPLLTATTTGPFNKKSCSKKFLNDDTFHSGGGGSCSLMTLGSVEGGWSEAADHQNAFLHLPHIL